MLNRIHQKRYRERHHQQLRAYRIAKKFGQFLKKLNLGRRRKFFAELGLHPLVFRLYVNHPSRFLRTVIRPALLDAEIPLSRGMPHDIRWQVQRALVDIIGITIRRYQKRLFRERRVSQAAEG
jgi:hypothetical protein